MVSCSEKESLIYNKKLSSVGPARVTGQDVHHDPTNMDLAMKLHYLKGVYYFSTQAFQGFTIMDIKEAMFTGLNYFYITCGRFRRSEIGRPYIKCNDCGVRFIEAQCEKSIDEWLEMKDVSLEKLLVSNQVLGPELAFSPSVLVQFTKFKCGGVSVGLSWAHILGDAFSAAEFMNMWGHLMSGHQPAQPINTAQSNTKSEISVSPPTTANDPLSVKRVGPVGDHWIAANNCKMEAFSFHVSATQLSDLQSKMCLGNDNNRITPFEALCAVIWQCVAKVKDGPEPKVVTICKKDSHNQKKGILSNNHQIISIVNANFSIIDANPKDLASLLTNQIGDERMKIEEAVQRDRGLSDFIIYGVNLTFVDLEDANFYGLELSGQKPVYVSYTIDGIGDDGVVLVLPTPKNAVKDGSGGRIVTITLPENQVLELKSELKRQWSIA